MSDNINGAEAAAAAEDTAAMTEQPAADDGGEPKKPLKLDYAQTFKVGFAFAIIMIFWTAYDFVVPLLLEHAYGLSNTIRGLIMGLDNLLSLFMLPLFGKLSDNAHGKLVKKFGRRTPFIVIGTLASVVLMVFVPISTLNQQKTATNIENGYLARLNEDAFMEERLSEFLDWEGSYADMNYMAMNGFTADDFMMIRYDDNFTATKAFLGMLGATTYTYNGEEVALDAAVGDFIDEEIEYVYVQNDDGENVLSHAVVSYADGTQSTICNWDGNDSITFADINTGNENYEKYAATGMNTWISDQIYDQATNTPAGHKSLAVYMVILLLVLIAMATFRSPAVALMPDVTPKPLRSQGNAVINLCGGIGGAIAFLIYTVVLFGERLENYVIIFASVAGGMLLLLAGFLAFVREKKMVQRCREICEEYGITDEEEESSPATDSSPADGASGELVGEMREAIKAKTRKLRTPKEWWEAKSGAERSRFVSFLLILASIFMWFMGYNAVSSNLSVYTTKALNLDAGVASIISGISMGISAIAFIPVGYMAAKLGRRKTIMIGLALAIISFLLIFAFVKPDSNALVPAALFALFYLIAGFGLIIINVNTLPMVVELSTDATVGQYTGYYYVATMSAQAVTPMFAGMVMDAFEDKGLFIYSAIFVALSIILMAFVKHGDSKPVGKGKKLTKEEKRQIRLESLGDPD